jgi:molecular chaperone IbpA
MTRELTLRSIDIPTVRRFGIGFESLFDDIIRASTQTNNYPPYNLISTGEDTVTIEVAVAGFEEGELTVTVDGRKLTISGDHVNVDAENWEYIHRGLSRRSFTLRFPLHEHVEVIDASMKNGILTVYLERKIPEEKKPKTIAINYNK